MACHFLGLFHGGLISFSRSTLHVLRLPCSRWDHLPSRECERCRSGWSDVVSRLSRQPRYWCILAGIRKDILFLGNHIMQMYGNFGRYPLFSMHCLGFGDILIPVKIASLPWKQALFSIRSDPLPIQGTFIMRLLAALTGATSGSYWASNLESVHFSEATPGVGIKESMESECLARCFGRVGRS